MLVLMDIFLGLIFHPPASLRVTASLLQTYFEYGRSIEGKLRRMMGASEQEDAPIVEAGWIGRECDRSIPLPVGKIAIDVYGMSFSNSIAIEMEKLDSRFVSRRFAGPGAPPSHSYACFVERYDAGRADAPIQIIGVLASSLRRMVTVSGLTTAFEHPQPFTYPRFTIALDGRLVPRWPSIRSSEDLREALADRRKWRAFMDELASLDYFFVTELMAASFADHSVIARMIRRAWGQRVMRTRTASLRIQAGFGGTSEIATVLSAILIDFTNRVRAVGGQPVVILIEDRGHGNILSTMVTPILQANQIDFVSTSSIAAPGDPANFESDGHFTPAVFTEIARATLQVLNQAPVPRRPSK